MTFARFAAAAAAFAASLVIGGFTGCGESESGTTGRRVALEVKIGASPESRQFVNARGWTVTLAKAAVSTGAFYFYDGEPLFARASQGASFAVVRSALAHPGHYIPGSAKGEMLTPSSADLLSGGALGSGQGVTGFVRSATFTFAAPAVGPLAGELGENVVVLEGSAAKGAETRSFRVELTADDVQDAKGIPQIEGCPFTSVDVESDGDVTITVKLTAWFDQVAFDDIPPSSDGKPVLLDDGLARRQLVRGTKGGLAYVFAFGPR